MKHSIKLKDGVGQLLLLIKEDELSQYYYKQKAGTTFHTIAWNVGSSQYVTIDNMRHLLPANTVLPIMLNQSFSFEQPENIIAWQFNKDFYCIVDHDIEVGCVGFIFFGPCPTMFIKLEKPDLEALEHLLETFEKEFLSDEEIKAEMLRMLLAQLIIKITRLAKKQYLRTTKEVAENKFDLIRRFCLLVEIHFRKEHKVNFYAELLNKSPKTIANYFSLYSTKTPLQIIQDRIIVEAKRLFYYTDKSVKEIAYELGFEDAAYFSKLFKHCTSQNPSELRKISLDLS